MFIQIDDKKYPCTWYAPTSETAVFTGIEGLTLPVTGTVWLYQDADEDGNAVLLAEQDCGGYSRQTYEDNILTLTNEPEAAAPTIDELRAAALGRIEGKCSAAIMAGVTVENKLFTLSELDQLSLSAALGQVNAGAATVMYAASGEALAAYTAAQIRAIHTAAYNWGLANRVYYALLKAWIARETDTAVLPTIDYGKALTSDLAATLTMELTAAGIDVAAFTATLTA